MEKKKLSRMSEADFLGGFDDDADEGNAKKSHTKSKSKVIAQENGAIVSGTVDKAMNRLESLALGKSKVIFVL